MRGRGERLEAALAERELDRMLVTDLINVRYLTGFTGTNGACVCGPGVRLFLTDFRYTERAAAEVEGWESLTVEGDWLGAIAERLEGRVGFEDDQMAVRTLAKLREKLAEGVEPVPAGGIVEALRRVKDEAELRAIEEASKLADEVWLWSIERGLAGRSERDVARAAEARIRELGGDPSFPAIVAAGPNGALPHAEPGEREIGEGELVVFDMGAQLDGYCSDGTRTFATGEPGEEARAVYATVLEAQLAALAAVRPGVTGEEVDAVARRLIDAAGHARHFGHGLGHGVGLEVHEGPRLSPKSDDVLAAGEVVTVEPGIYLPGRLGVRIEDFVVISEDGNRNLSTLPKELQILSG
jgi:Xaa-Pro aminopeptidase